ncbi:hypothetical protein PIB30_038899 [Stylosanthes scabra]|uniref:Uncharacterized protein n=1 Tax=Stylosanthes scabra TaxID=79078 RepID=A0ABU6ZCT8_9FABA|nr:hypothetical protein [Stylosanthes scabra]
MARKTMAKKLKGSRKKKEYNKSNRTRCSPSDVAKLLEKLSSEQKAVVRDMGFGVLENLSILNISKKMMMELVDSFNTNDNSMRTTLGMIKLDASKIGMPLDRTQGRTIIKTTVDSEENTRKFKRAFILFIQKTFLCATNSNPLSPKHFPAIVNVDNPRQMNWARHVCSFLLDGIAEIRRKNSKGVEGCVFAMLIIYLHETHFGEYSEDDEARPPWISYWRADRLKKRLQLEKKDSTGLLSQAKQRKERMKKKKTTDPKRVETSTKMGKKDILNSKLVKSMEMEDTTKEKRTLEKRKHHEKTESEDISSDSESEPDSERTISQDDK